MSNIRTLAVLGLDVLALNMQRKKKKKLLSLCVIKAAKLQTL